jgi:hypothetical protein
MFTARIYYTPTLLSLQSALTHPTRKSLFLCGEKSSIPKLNNMQSKATTITDYLAQLPEDRQEPMARLRDTINTHLPKEFSEGMGYGMIGWGVPHSLYPAGYHCDPKLPLPFLSIASQKNFIAVYHMGLYSDPALLEWFTSEYPKHVKTKLDMGKGCVRFKKVDLIPYELIAELCTRMSADEWIARYESALKR